jgi:hypothetical protein
MGAVPDCAFPNEKGQYNQVPGGAHEIGQKQQISIRAEAGLLGDAST